MGLRIGDEMHVARRVPLEPGRDAALLLRFYNPHLNDTDVEQLALQVLAPPDVLEAKFAERFPTAGEVEVALPALGPDPSLTLQIGPGVAQHTSITERFSTRAARSRAAGSQPVVVKRDLPSPSSCSSTSSPKRASSGCSPCSPTCRRGRWR